MSLKKGDKMEIIRLKINDITPSNATSKKRITYSFWYKGGD